MITQPNNASFASLLTTDKICGVLSDTFVAGAPNLGGSLYQLTIPHAFTRPVFCDALFSADNTTYVPNGQSDGTNYYQTYSDSNNVYLLTTAASGAIYYKEVSTWIDNFDSTNPFVAQKLATNLATTNKFYSDSRKNYQKVFLPGVVTLANPGVGNVGTYVIAHPPGPIPNYKIFFESLPGQVWPSISGGAADTWLYDVAHQYECYGVVNGTNLTVSFTPGISSASTMRLWFRIYYDV